MAVDCDDDDDYDDESVLLRLYFTQSHLHVEFESDASNVMWTVICQVAAVLC